ncbi:hypothetical protein [Aureicoccus marinus]|uniref:Uncharacterized protein n=1 Tax=Aureicoccus marinus TaxID=754435 RepID=A0A2S7T6Z4_9FLAO|nr:hypothetical protein [Aureicoccus marinus]PQJ15680.1 hypothetical protein BST99_08010 [Aureicoccus marinus]
MKSNPKTRFALYTALISFVLGSAIISGYYWTLDSGFVTLGLIFLFVAVLFNLLVLIRLLFLARKDDSKHPTYLKTAGIMLLNIPIVLVYLQLAFSLSSTFRVKFVNRTESEMSNIHLQGCDHSFIGSLKPGESANISFEIPNDCGLSVQFSSEGKVYNETIADYLTVGMSASISHPLGRGDQFFP